MGKVGAAVGAYSFSPIAESNPKGYAVVMGMCCAIAFAGAGMSFLCLDLVEDGLKSGPSTSLQGSSSAADDDEVALEDGEGSFHNSAALI